MSATRPVSHPATAAPAAPNSLHVLVVDDTQTNRQILAVFLRKLGHRVDLAEDGARAVEMFAAVAYDLVIMDVMMPVMDGYEATRRIKAICGERWVPVVFLSALDKDESLVSGLDAGGDDYLPKPVNFVVLEAKLRSLSRTILLYRELEKTRRDLQAYYDERETENLLAVEILDQLMRRPGLVDPTLHYWMSPATHFSGDVAAAARTADGRFYVLLADATGHGLAAAISVLPVLTLFYDIVNICLPVPRLVAKINDQLRAALPVGRFVACACVCVDPAHGECEFWVGGMPAVLLLDAAGQVVREVAATHLPLGIEEMDWRAAAGEMLPLPAGGGQLVLLSDGLLEARNAAGEEFGRARLHAALAGVPSAQRLEAVRDAIFAHLGEAAPHDDVTLILIDLPAKTGG
jgi:CheY-like chemotaxis protein